MPGNANKANKKRSSSAVDILQLTKKQLENLVQDMVFKVTKPLEEKIALLNGPLEELKNSQSFICQKHNDLAGDYSEILQTNKQQKQDIKQLTKRADIIQKQNDEDHLKIDEVEQYDRRQKLELQDVPMTKNEDVMKITLDLIKKLDVDIEEEDISIAHCHPQKRRLGRTRASKATNHPTIIVCLVSRLKCNEIYANRFEAKKDIGGFPVDVMEKVFINENLTQRRKRLFWNTK